ncbi:MAG: hypothetical protein E7103_10285 [Prevotella sp.]|nr:hypothetical protein [Prevotella sp.]
MDRFQLQKLRDLPIEAVAERLGLRVSRHKCLCPFHDDHHASLSFKVSKNTFRCFVCGASGGTIDLVMRYLRMSFLEATKWLENIDHSPFLRPDGSKRPSAERSIDQYDAQKAFDASRYNRYFERPWLSDEARRFLFEERRLDERVVRWCRLTSWKDKQGIPWLQSPYYDREGKLVGVQNRNLIKGATPRFRFPSGSQCSIYNLPVLGMLKPGEALWITEGCSDCWAMLSAGHKAIAIPSATLLKRRDVELLRSLTGLPSDSPEVPPSSSPEGECLKASPRGGLEGVSGLGVLFHMYPDRDEPGERLFMQLKEVLPALEHHQLPPDCKDYSEYYLSKLRGQASD